MVLTTTPAGEIGHQAPDFRLEDADGRVWTLAEIKGDAGTVVAFICNHCPYVKAVIDRFVDDAKAMQAKGIGIVAIMPNNWQAYPADAPEKMKDFAQAHSFTFPYLVDATQSVARAYGALCTPDIFGFDKDMTLKYRGRVDSGANRPADASTRREMLEAMNTIAETGEIPPGQHPSIGCSIKWRS
jgi:peroxiredoxin